MPCCQKFKNKFETTTSVLFLFSDYQRVALRHAKNEDDAQWLGMENNHFYMKLLKMILFG